MLPIIARGRDLPVAEFLLPASQEAGAAERSRRLTQAVYHNLSSLGFARAKPRLGDHRRWFLGFDPFGLAASTLSSAPSIARPSGSRHAALAGGAG